MSMPQETETDSTPELDEVLQEYQPEHLGVDIHHIKEPVRVYQLPSRIGTSRNYKADATNPVPLLNADNRRRRATIVAMLTTSGDSATSGGILLGGIEDVKRGDAAIWPYNVPCVLEHAELVYVKAAGTVTTPVVVSLISENWAD